MTTPLDALTAPVSLTLLTATKGHASKKLIPAWTDDAPVVDPAHSLWIAEGHVEHVQVPGLAGLQDLLGRITPKQALVHGIPTGSAPGAMFQLVVAEKYTRAPDTSRPYPRVFQLSARPAASSCSIMTQTLPHRCR